MNSLYDIYDYTGMKVDHGGLVGVARLRNLSDGDTTEYTVFAYKLRVNMIKALRRNDAVLTTSNLPANRVLVMCDGVQRAPLLLYKMETTNGVCQAILFRRDYDDPIVCVVEFF